MSEKLFAHGGSESVPVEESEGIELGTQPDESTESSDVEKNTKLEEENAEVSIDQNESIEDGEDSIEKLKAECSKISTLARVIDDLEFAAGSLNAMDSFMMRDDFMEDLGGEKWKFEYDIDNKELKITNSQLTELPKIINDNIREMQRLSEILLRGKPGFFAKKETKDTYRQAEKRQVYIGKQINFEKDILVKAQEMSKDIIRKIRGFTPESFPQMLDKPVGFESFIAKLRAELELTKQLEDQYPNAKDLVDRYKKLQEVEAVDSAKRAQK